jgi:beta-glucosidase-like glycosyl hydrolase
VGQGDEAQWKSAYDQGLVSEEEINHSALKVLEVAFKIGAFENPYADPSKAGDIIASHNQSAINCQLKAMTLLKKQKPGFRSSGQIRSGCRRCGHPSLFRYHL